MSLPYCEPYKMKSVEPVFFTTREEREVLLKKASYNLFNLPSSAVTVDLLTDSGTGAMSQEQWAEIMRGDESYAGSRSFFLLKETVWELMGMPFMLPTHQGRAAENVLFSTIIGSHGEGKVVPGNSHFDTTKGHIEFRHAKAIDCTIQEAFDTSSPHPFKGNIDLIKLENVFKTYGKEKIPVCLVTVTCNSSGGQPVSLENLHEVSKLCQKYEIPLFMDSARFAENAYFIKQREKAYQNKTIREIVKEMFSLVDGMTMSSKKDGIVNIGGLLAMRDEDLYKRASTYNIMFEGFNTYGGMAGRDLGALAVGLKEATEESYLEARIGQVHELGRMLKEFGIDVQEPFGGHAIFVDALKFFPHIPREEFPAQLLGAELYLEAGVRGVEIVTLLADRDPVSRENRYPALELLRLAIPRRVYTSNHMKYVAEALRNVKKRAHTLTKGLKIVEEAPIMRHFTVKLDRLS